VSDFHDELAQETLRMAENLRATVPTTTYAELTRRCKTEPERMAQILMCALVWVDVDAPAADLIRRAEGVAADNERSQLRLVPDMDEWIDVTLRHDIHTEVGLLAAGSVQRGIPDAPGVWRVRVTENDEVTVPEASIARGGKRRAALLRGRDAREEYEFARKQLGYSHLAAVQWLLETYGVSERQLYRWGFHSPRSEAAS
jgi:hypothetical protein